MVGIACAWAGGDPEVEAASPSAPRLLFDLPAGVRITIDGEFRGTTPTGPLEFGPGAHHVELESRCERVRLVDVEVQPGETRTIDEAAVPELGYATLVLRATTLDRKPLDAEVAIDGQSLGTAVFASPLRVAACPGRLHVTHAGLGGFIEDIAFASGAMVEREIVLAPGSDMVRIEGGPFVLGAPAHLIEWWRKSFFFNGMTRAEEAYVWKHGLSEEIVLEPELKQQRNVLIETFEIDQHEVTVEQFQECWAAGGLPPCRPEFMNGKGCEGRTGCYIHSGLETRTDYMGDDKVCSMDSWHNDYRMRFGAKNRPVNCLAGWQAEQYCRWLGKRLPTAAEFEFAARSRRVEYIWPWGNDDPDCSRTDAKTTPMDEGCAFEPRSTSITRSSPTLLAPPVCARPRGLTEQGLCDMMGSMQEYVTLGDVPAMFWMVRGQFYHPSVVFKRWLDSDHPNYPLSASHGFRCARDVVPSSARAAGGPS